MDIIFIGICFVLLVALTVYLYRKVRKSVRLANKTTLESLTPVAEGGKGIIEAAPPSQAGTHEEPPDDAAQISTLNKMRTRLANLKYFVTSTVKRLPRIVLTVCLTIILNQVLNFVILLYVVENLGIPAVVQDVTITKVEEDVVHFTIDSDDTVTQTLNVEKMSTELRAKVTTKSTLSHPAILVERGSVRKRRQLMERGAPVYKVIPEFQKIMKFD